MSLNFSKKKKGNYKPNLIKKTPEVTLEFLRDDFIDLSGRQITSIKW